MCDVCCRTTGEMGRIDESGGICTERLLQYTVVWHSTIRYLFLVQKPIKYLVVTLSLFQYILWYSTVQHSAVLY